MSVCLPQAYLTISIIIVRYYDYDYNKAVFVQNKHMYIFGTVISKTKSFNADVLNYLSIDYIVLSFTQFIC